jgi:hypothetical protein
MIDETGAETMDPGQIPDPFAIDGEFDAVADFPMMEESPYQASQDLQPAGVSRVVDLGDGNGPQEFTAESDEVLLQQVLQAQQATFQRQMSQAQLLGGGEDPDSAPQFDPTQEVQPLTEGELAQMALNWAADPVGHVQRILESQVGMSIGDLKQTVNDLQEMRASAYYYKVGKEFQSRHTDDYYPSGRNRDLMLGFLDRQQLPYTPQNYEYAYASLKSGGMLEPPPKNWQPTADAGGTAISDAEDESVAASTGGMTAEEAEAAAWKMPYKQLEASLRRR